jgi:hypothetical protein
VAPVGLARGSPLFRLTGRVEDFVTDFIRGRYAREFLAGWGTMDFNGHMANTAYLNLAADVRMAFFAEHGFPLRVPAARDRTRRRRDGVEYFREDSTTR